MRWNATLELVSAYENSPSLSSLGDSLGIILVLGILAACMSNGTSERNTCVLLVHLFYNVVALGTSITAICWILTKSSNILDPAGFPLLLYVFILASSMFELLFLVLSMDAIVSVSRVGQSPSTTTRSRDVLAA